MGTKSSKTILKPNDYKLNGKYFVMIKFSQFSNDIFFDKMKNVALKKPILYGFFFFKSKTMSDNFLKNIDSEYTNDPHCYIMYSDNMNIISNHYVNKITFSFEADKILGKELFDVSNEINKLEIKGFNQLQTAIKVFDDLFKLCSNFYENYEKLQIFNYNEKANNLNNSNISINELIDDFNYNLIDINTSTNGSVNGSKLYLRFSENIYECNGEYNETSNCLFSNLIRTNDLMYLMSKTNTKIKNVKQENNILKEKIEQLEEKIKQLETKIEQPKQFEQSETKIDLELV